MDRSEMDRVRPDPVRPETPARPGWQLDPWGDGERYWDGEVWTRQTRHADAVDSPRVAPDAQPAGPTEAPAATPRPERPRYWELAADPDDDQRPMRSGLMRGMIWAFAVAAIVGMLAAAIAVWPVLLRGGVDEPSPVVPQQSAQGWASHPH